MPVIVNTQARLLIGPTVKPKGKDKKNAHKPSSWLPGKNSLDKAYWDQIKNAPTIRNWLKLGWLKIAMDEEVPAPPTFDELAAMSEDELNASLDNEDVPVTWHPLIRAEIERRGSH